MPLTLTSPAFGEGQTIPDEFARETGNVSPPLEWSGAPEETKSFALVVEDPDAPGGVFRHWAIHDLPPNHGGLAKGVAERTSAPQAVNDFGEAGYGGPMPPAGHGAHRYQFRLMALNVPALETTAGADARSVATSAARHTLEESVLTGLYERSSKQA